LKSLFSNLKEKNTFIFFLVIFAIFAIAFDPSHNVDKIFLTNFDKIKHILAFVVISYLFIESSIKLKVILKIAILVLIAFFIEYVQFMIGREASSLDFLASISGIGIFFLVRFFVLKDSSK